MFASSDFLNRPSTDHDQVDTVTLVRQVRLGDAVAFEQLYKYFWTGLYRFAFAFVRNADEAEDLVQQVFFRIWREREHWNPLGPLERYLYTAVRNAARDRIRRERTARTWQDRQTEKSDAAFANETMRADSELALLELDAAIQQALAALPGKRRAICILRWRDRLSYAEIAERLGITEKTVETQIARGLKWMRDRLHEWKETS